MPMLMYLEGVALVCAVTLFQLIAIPALLRRRNDYADVIWGPAFPLAAAGAYALTGGRAYGPRALLVLTLVSVWAARLAWHIGRRVLGSNTEDARYAKWRRDWGATQVWRSWLQVWILQPVLLALFLAPVLVVLAAGPAPIGAKEFAGAAIWLLGFLFEAIGDRQLRQFHADPANRGTLMTRGLWSWSRHPNYFGEITLWWGIWLIAAGLPGSWWSLVSPLALTFVIWQISGVKLMESHMRDRPGFSAYAERTSVFFPRPPRT